MDGQMLGSRDSFGHCPIWIKEDSTNWDPKSFKFFNFWVHHPEFIPFVRKVGDFLKVSGNAIFSFKEKLRLLKGELNKWNK